jgi:hypothetical protein
MPTNASNGNVLVMTVTKALVVLIMVGTFAYCTVAQIPIDQTVLTIMVGVLGVKEAVSGLVYYKTTTQDYKTVRRR